MRIQRPGIIGQKVEKQAESFLQRQGLKVVARNFRCKLGEIDLIMLDGDTLVFVEVRYRQKNSFGSGIETITATKQRRLINTALYYLQSQANQAPACRFDVISASGESPDIEFQWVQNAIESA